MKSIVYAVMVITLCVAGTNLNAQNIFPSSGSVGIGTTSPDSSSVLEIKIKERRINTPYDANTT